jgi:hypothetical protein
VYRAQEQTPPRSRLLSRLLASVARASPPRHTSSEANESWAAARSCSRSSGATIRVPVAPAADFKRCCMLSGELDGSDRDYFFQIEDDHWARASAFVVPAGATSMDRRPAARALDGARPGGDSRVCCASISGVCLGCAWIARLTRHDPRAGSRVHCSPVGIRGKRDTDRVDSRSV